MHAHNNAGTLGYNLERTAHTPTLFNRPLLITFKIRYEGEVLILKGHPARVQ